MISFECQCGKHYELPDQILGKRVKCRVCGIESRVPEFAPVMLDEPPQAPQMVPAPMISVSGISTPILISGISNLLIGLVLSVFLIGVPLIVLSVFEIIHFSKASAMPPAEYASKARTISVLEMIAGICNWIGLICGIIAFINAGQVREQAARVA